jgi:hypothetical protein
MSKNTDYGDYLELHLRFVNYILCTVFVFHKQKMRTNSDATHTFSRLEFWEKYMK